MTNTPTPASHAVNTAPISADLWGIEQAAPQHVATVWVDDDGCNDFEQSPFFNLPAGEHKLYTGAASASPAKQSKAQHSTAQHSTAQHSTAQQDAPAAAWMTPDGDRVGTETTMAGARKDDRLHVILEEERSEAAAPVDLPEPWGACVSGRIWVGKLPEHARRLVEAESLPIQWLYTAATVRQLLERKP